MTPAEPGASVPRDRPHSVSAVLPAYNEVAVIADVVRRTHAALVAACLGDHEVVVVDDGSRDGTAAVLAALARELPSVRVVTHPVNRGYGGALRSGFEAARCDLVWLLDSDGQFDPAELTRLLDAWTPGVFVAGYRVRRSDPVMRRANHAAFFGLVRLVMGPTVRDVNCAFKLFPRAVGVGLHSEGAVISTELVLRARREGVAIVEVPVPHLPRTTGTATGADPRVVAKAFVELAGLRRALRTGQTRRAQPDER